MDECPRGVGVSRGGAMSVRGRDEVVGHLSDPLHRLESTTGKLHDSNAAGRRERGGTSLNTPDNPSIVHVLIIGQAEQIIHSLYCGAMRTCDEAPQDYRGMEGGTYIAV